MGTTRQRTHTNTERAAVRLTIGDKEFLTRLSEDLGMNKSEVLRLGLHMLVGARYGSMALFKHGGNQAIESRRKPRGDEASS